MCSQLLRHRTAHRILQILRITTTGPEDLVRADLSLEQRREIREKKKTEDEIDRLVQLQGVVRDRARELSEYRVMAEQLIHEIGLREEETKRCMEDNDRQAEGMSETSTSTAEASRFVPNYDVERDEWINPLAMKSPSYISGDQAALDRIPTIEDLENMDEQQIRELEEKIYNDDGPEAVIYNENGFQIFSHVMCRTLERRVNPAFRFVLNKIIRSKFYPDSNQEHVSDEVAGFRGFY